MENKKDVIELARKLCQIAKDENVYGEEFNPDENWFNAKPVLLFDWVKTLDAEIQLARQKKEQERELSDEELEVVEEIYNRYK